MRGSTQTVFTGDLVWKDGRTDIFPPILRAHSGWWYRPETVKGKKTFGMGSKGHEAAEQFHHKMFYDALQRHPNQHPVKIGRPHKSNEMRVTNGAVCYLAYTHPVYGDIHLIFTAYAGGYGRRQSSISYELSMHRLLAVITLGETPQVWNKNARVFSHRQEIETQDIEAEIQRFQKDPWRVVTTKLKIPQELMEALQPPDDLVEARIEFSEEPTTYENGITTYASRALRHYLGTEVRKITRDSMKQLTELGEALKYFGVQFNVRQTYSYGGEPNTITGLDITIPPSKEKGNEEGHSISIKADGVTVDCGYVRQEQRYHQYEIEQAKQLLADKAFDVFEDFEYERKE